MYRLVKWLDDDVFVDEFGDLCTTVHGQVHDGVICEYLQVARNVSGIAVERVGEFANRTDFVVSKVVENLLAVFV